MDISSKELFSKKKWARGLRSLKVGTHRVPLEGRNSLNSLRMTASRLNENQDEANSFDISVTFKTNTATVVVKRRE